MRAAASVAMCASTKPGSSHLPLRSSTVAPTGAGVLPICSTRPSRTIVLILLGFGLIYQVVVSLLFEHLHRLKEWRDEKEKHSTN